jgi:hypothetical protein
MVKTPILFLLLLGCLSRDRVSAGFQQPCLNPIQTILFSYCQYNYNRNIVQGTFIEAEPTISGGLFERKRLPLAGF